MLTHPFESLNEQIECLDARCVALRRQLHSNPEPSGEEKESSLLLYTELGNAGFDVRLGPEGYGVIAEFAHGRPNDSLPLIGLRADIDALRIQDEKEVPYRSKNPGIMHACGHDVHSAIVLGTLLALKQAAAQGAIPFPIRVRGIFQPAEETCAGAQQMIAADVLDGVAAILATHVDPSLPVGRVGLRSGTLTATCDEVLIDIHGRGGHAARPHESKDPIAAAAQLINAVYLHLPRVTDSQDAVVITMGKIAGGHTSNVIPERVELQGTMRTLDMNVRDRANEHLRRIAEGIAMTSETRIHVRFGVSSPSVVNDPSMVQLIEEVARNLLGDAAIYSIPRASMGSEDFAFYLQHVPGALIRLGCISKTVRATGLHTPTFDVDERVIRVGMRVLAHSILRWFGGDQYGLSSEDTVNFEI